MSNGDFQGLIDEIEEQRKPKASKAEVFELTADAFRLKCGTVYREHSGRVLKYTGKRYVEVPSFEAELREWMRRVGIPQTNHRVSNVVPILRTDLRCGEGHPSLPFWAGGQASDARRTVALDNGILDVEAALSGVSVLQPHTPDWVSETCLPFAYVAGAGCPTWIGFLDEVLEGDEEAVECLQKWIGLNLVSDMSHQKVMMMVGKPRAGKGTIVRVLEKLLGDENLAHPTFSSLADKFGPATLLGKTAAILPDAHMGRETDAVKVLELIKSVSGQDGVEIERKYRDRVSGIRLQTRFTIVCNSMPRFPDESKAIGKRMIILPFHQDFSGREDIELDQKLAAELSGIFLWALEGLRKIRETGLSQPACGQDLRNAFDAASSPMSVFVEECCELGEERYVARADLYHANRLWRDRNGFAQLSSVTFGKELRAVASRIVEGRPGSHAGPRQRCYGGITLSSEGLAMVRRESYGDPRSTIMMG